MPQIQWRHDTFRAWAEILNLHLSEMQQKLTKSFSKVNMNHWYPKQTHYTDGKEKKGIYWVLWQGLEAGDATEAAFGRSCQKLLLWLMEPVPASSEMDPSLAKAELSSDAGRDALQRFACRFKCQPQRAGKGWPRGCTWKNMKVPSLKV